MKLVRQHSLTTKDTKRIREALKNASLKVTRCKLGSNRYYILVVTNDNIKALEVIENLGYTLDSIWRKTLENHSELFRNDNLKIHKETVIREA